MNVTATTHIPRQSANNHFFRRALFCSFGVRNIVFVVIFFPFSSYNIEFELQPCHLSFTYGASLASKASTG